ncbi:MAG: ATP-binding cassette domain-containing protein [Actinomycetota bacterium]|nr:ATP-binding cassette domain-containing protein [Actinomycetota bacterium]
MDDLSFQIRRGVIAGFLGPNGAGKTTTIRALLGLVHPSEGAASVFGQPYRELTRPVAKVGAVLGPSGFHPARTARKHLEIVATGAGIDRSRVDETLALVDLEDRGNDRVGAYSLGMKQRLALAEALLADPESLVLDEPGNGLDPAGMRWLRGLLKEMAAQGKTILVSSHLLSEVAEIAEEVVVIHRGQLIAHDTVAEVTARRRIVRLRAEETERLRDAIRGRATAVQREGDNLLVEGLEIEEVGRIAAAAGCVVLRLEEVRPALEEAFFELVEGGADA